MNQCHDFAKNLDAIRRSQNLSLAEFAVSLNIPRSTLQDILKDGHTTLDTALRISKERKAPLSVLTGELVPQEDAGTSGGCRKTTGKDGE